MKNRLKQKLYSDESTLGTWITIGNPDIVEILEQFSFDWFVFDVEHSYFSLETVKTMMQSLSEEGPTPIVRIGQVDQLLAKGALDAGAQGLLAPLINRREDAERLASYSMYPPNGVRGAGPGRASKFGMNFKEYLETANRELLLAVQIETTEALSRVDEIVETKGIDIGFVGPTDLTISLGLGTERSNPKVTEAMERVIASCKSHGKVPGTLAVSVEEARKFLKMGFKFVALASDSRFLAAGAKTYLEAKS